MFSGTRREVHGGARARGRSDHRRSQLAGDRRRPTPPVDRTDVIDAYIAHARLALPEPERLGRVQDRDRHRQWRDDHGRAAAVRASSGSTSTCSCGIEPDGRNINLDCGSTHPEQLARAGARRAAVGWALRSTATAIARSSSMHDGRIVDGDAVLLMCARHMKAAGPAEGQCGRRHRDEQHRSRDRAARQRDRTGALRRRRQVRDGGDAQARPVDRRRAVGAHHLLGPPVHRRRHRHGAERAARDGRHAAASSPIWRRSW